tara:strand:+ start:24 stop:371 length:348 start_codon:yes stop_codon:yes gene_type:complete
MNKSYNCLGKGLNKEYFRIHKNNNDKFKSLEYFIDNINFDDYFIYKSSNKFRRVSVEEFKEFKYVSFIFFRKDLYNEKDFELWLYTIYESINIDMRFITKPFPSVNYLKLIKVYE